MIRRGNVVRLFGEDDVLDRLVPDDDHFLGQIGDPLFDGWQAHALRHTRKP